MNPERKTEIAVGFSVSIALLILIVGIIWGKRIDFSLERHFLNVQFTDIQGLERGDPVYVRGIRYGEVDRINLRHDHALVRMWIRSDVPLYSDLNVAVEMKEVMGGKQITIDPGTSGESADLEKTYIGESRGTVIDLMAKTEQIMARVDSTLYFFHTFLETDRLNRALANAETAADQARLLVTENRKGLREIVQRLQTMTQSLQKDSTLARASHVVAELDTTVQYLKKASIRLDSEEGTAGKLLRDRWLYDQLLNTAANLDSLILDIKTNPKKYMHISLF